MKSATLITMMAIVPMLVSVPASGQQFMKSHSERSPRTPTTPVTPVPPAPWQEQDPAVALYRQARGRLNDGNYESAADLFGQIIRKYPRSTYTPDAYYWRGFALYKADDLKEARTALEEQQKKYPNAATARDGRELLTRVRGALAAGGDSRSAEQITQTAKGTGQGCPREDDEDDVRIAALNSFLNMNSEQAIPLLKQILARRDACSAPLRRKAVFLVSQKRGADVEEILLSAARNDPDKEVRSQAVFWLSQVGSDRAIGYLEDILKTSTDSEVRDKAIFAVSQHRSERAGQILRSYAENPSAPDELREKAIFWLGQKRSPDNTAFLKSLYVKERNLELKDKIIFSLSQQSGNQSWLMEVANNESENIEMRKKALFWAGQSKSTSMTELTALYDRMKNREMKEQLIFVYSQRREREAVDKLMAIAKSDTDRELRKKAMFWLSQSKDPRVAEFLMQLINQ
jgi:HEAT repeat protein